MAYEVTAKTLKVLLMITNNLHTMETNLEFVLLMLCRENMMHKNGKLDIYLSTLCPISLCSLVAYCQHTKFWQVCEHHQAFSLTVVC